MRILVLGAGVIGSVYAGKFVESGHDVVLVARGSRLSDLQNHGLVLEDAETKRRVVRPIRAVSELGIEDGFDLVLVPVRYEQLTSTLPMLKAMSDASDVVFFGNTAGRQAELVAALGKRVIFGFPAAGGTRDGPVIRYVLISQQKTMLGEATGASTPRVELLRGVFNAAGFPTAVTINIEGWLLGHAAFVVPIAFALYRAGTDPGKLANDAATVRLMVLATRQSFHALCSAGSAEVPTNLRILYRLPTPIIVAYWRRVFASPRGELWFAAHSRAAPEEMNAMAAQLRAALLRTGRPTPDLLKLLPAT